MLRQGKVAASIETEQATERSLAQEMVGREVIFRTERPKVEPGKAILQVEGFVRLSDQGVIGFEWRVVFYP